MRRPAALALLAMLVTSACAGTSAHRAAAQPATTTTAPSPSPTTPAATSAPATTPPTTPPARPSLTAVPRAAYPITVSRVTAADLPHSYRPGCPVGPSQLRLLRLGFWGFDGRTHAGSIVVNAAVVPAVSRIFRRLYEARFPIRSLQPIDAYGGSDDRSMAADNTSGFNCRYAVAPGPHHWSVHAYGEAIDVDPVENPYVEGGQVRPPNGAAYVARSPVRPGMAVSGGVLVRAFAAEGWQWGGRWSASPDYQHFSATGG